MADERHLDLARHDLAAQRIVFQLPDQSRGTRRE
jgi:hypothetical protein